MVYVTIRLGWDAHTLSHDGVQYESPGHSRFTVPWPVYADLRDRGISMKYLSQTDDEEGPASESEGSDHQPVSGVDSSAPLTDVTESQSTDESDQA